MPEQLALQQRFRDRGAVDCYEGLRGTLACGVDATRKWPEEGFTRPWPEVIRMSGEVRARVDALWKKAGL